MGEQVRPIILGVLVVGLVGYVLWGLVKWGQRPSKFWVGVFVVSLVVLGGFEARWLWLQGEATRVVKTVSGNPDGYAHCQRLTETFFDGQVATIGWVSWGEIDRAVIKYTQCQEWWNVLTGDKKHLTDKQLIAVGVIIHEAYHVGGEQNEATTQCLTIKKFPDVLETIGVPQNVIPEYEARYETMSAMMRTQYLGGVC